jgi:NADH dehydrogenase
MDKALIASYRCAMTQALHVVTGAFGYSGQCIAKRLLAAGHRVRTLTNSSQRQNPLHDRLEIFPFHFDDPARLAESLRGAEVLYNTYWVRFNNRTFTFQDAVRNTQALFAAACAAGVRRVVHVSITNPDPVDRPSGLEYFRGKGVLEKALVDSGLSYAILRPAVLFGMEDILVNNIAWMLRHFPFVGVFGDGRYRLQPIFVDDLAALAVDQGARAEDAVVQAIGPETFTYRELLEAMGAIIGKRRRILSVSPAVGHALGWGMSLLMRDVMITRDEIRGLMENRLFVDAPAPALAVTKLTEWAQANRDWLGVRYASELARRRDRRSGYGRGPG